MDRTETAGILAVLRAAYPNFYKGMSRDELVSIVGLWSEMLADYPAGVVAAAVKAHIAADRKGYPPHIGAIIDAIGKVTKTDDLTEGEAWALIAKATLNSTYNSEAEFNKLPVLLQRIVGSHNQLRDWALMPRETVQSVVQSNFLRSFRARAEHDREYLAMPEHVRGFMEELSGRMAIPALEKPSYDADKFEHDALYNMPQLRRKEAAG